MMSLSLLPSSLVFWALILSSTVWETIAAATPRSAIQETLSWEEEHLIPKLENLNAEIDWFRFLFRSDSAGVQLFNDEKSCYSTFSPIIQDVIKAEPSPGTDYYFSMVQFADWLLNDIPQSKKHTCLKLVADDIFNSIGNKASEMQVRWTCDWTCSCRCDSLYTFMQNLYSKNGYTLTNKQPDKVKFCREVRKRNWAYLWQRYRDRCWTDCVRYGKCSPIYSSMHFALILLLGATLRRIYLNIQ